MPGIFRITAPCVMAAIIRSVPCWQKGQRAMSRQTRAGAAAPSSSAAPPCPSPPRRHPAGGAWG
jgi:hypothetical protein